MQKNFESLIIFADKHQLCIEESVVKSIKWPVLLLQSTTNSTAEAIPGALASKAIVNSQILVVFCIDDTPAFEIKHIEVMLNFLEYKRGERIIFYWNKSYSGTNQEQLKQLFLYCQRNYLLNAISIFKDYTNTMQFYTYTQFPVFKLQMKNLQADHYFPNQLRNMHGAAIRTMPDQIQPRNIIYRDKSGQVRLIGYCTKIVRSFAAKHNATIVFPFPLKPEVSYLPNQIHNMTMNGILDIPMSMLSPVAQLNYNVFTTIIEPYTVRLLLPLPPLLTVQEIFQLIFISLFTLIVAALLIIFSTVLAFEHLYLWDQDHDQLERFFPIFSYMTMAITLRGILGKNILLPKLLSFSSTFKKCIYICLFLSGIFVSTTYTAYLQSYFTSAPYGSRIQNYDELRKSTTRICLHSSLYQFQRITSDPHKWQKLKDIYYVTSNISEYRHNRHILNPRYGYLASPPSMSVMLEQQQRLFERPLFYVPAEISIKVDFYLAIPLHPHSIYRHVINKYIFQILESGILNFWMGMAYEDFRTAGFLTDRKVQPRKMEKYLKVVDFYWIWWMYGLGLMIGLIVFMVENIRYGRSTGAN